MAFIEFGTDADALRAIEQFHDKDFQGRKITVNVARPREDSAPRERGGGGDRGGDRGERRERY